MARSVSVSEIPFFTSAQVITSSGWMMWQMISQPSWRCLPRIFRWSQVWLFFLWEGWVDLFIVFWGLDILGRIKGDFFKDFGYKSVFCLTAWLCLSTILPEAGRIGAPKDIQIFPLPETNIFADGHVVWIWTLFQLLISNLESSFLGSSHSSLSLEKWTILQSIIFLEGLKWRTVFHFWLLPPIICRDGRVRRCAPSRSCI